jgi:SAM-dependent methyltransferase
MIPLDPIARAGLRAVLRESRTRKLPPRVAVAMLLVACPDPAAVAAYLRTTPPADPAQLATWRRLLGSHRDGCARIAKLLRNGAAEPRGRGLPAVLEMFARAAAIDPVCAMALHTLGDPAELARGAAEVTAWLRAHRLLGPTRRTLEIGCGTGRMPAALAPHCARADAVEPVPALARAARAHCRTHANVRIHRTDGRDLRAFRDHAYDLIYAVDAFPYLVAADLADRHVAECARVLGPGGDLVIINWSYDHDARSDRAAVRALAHHHGFRVLRAGGRPFTTWDGELFHLRKRARASVGSAV